MIVHVGIDLGSTTTKAVVLDEAGSVMGRGITNSRSNYEVACQVAIGEALINARFSLLRGELAAAGFVEAELDRWLAVLERLFRAEQYRSQLTVLTRELTRFASRQLIGGGPLRAAVERITSHMRDEIPELYAESTRRKSDFFRDLAGSRFMKLAVEPGPVPYGTKPLVPSGKLGTVQVGFVKTAGALPLSPSSSTNRIAGHLRVGSPMPVADQSTQASSVKLGMRKPKSPSDVTCEPRRSSPARKVPRPSAEVCAAPAPTPPKMASAPFVRTW